MFEMWGGEHVSLAEVQPATALAGEALRWIARGCCERGSRELSAVAVAVRWWVGMVGAGCVEGVPREGREGTWRYLKAGRE